METFGWVISRHIVHLGASAQLLQRTGTSPMSRSSFHEDVRLNNMYNNVLCLSFHDLAGHTPPQTMGVAQHLGHSISNSGIWPGMKMEPTFSVWLCFMKSWEVKSWSSWLVPALTRRSLPHNLDHIRHKAANQKSSNAAVPYLLARNHMSEWKRGRVEMLTIMVLLNVATWVFCTAEQVNEDRGLLHSVWVQRKGLYGHSLHLFISTILLISCPGLHWLPCHAAGNLHARLPIGVALGVTVQALCMYVPNIVASEH